MKDQQTAIEKLCLNEGNDAADSEVRAIEESYNVVRNKYEALLQQIKNGDIELKSTLCKQLGIDELDIDETSSGIEKRNSN